MSDYDVEVNDGVVSLRNGGNLKGTYTLQELGLSDGADRSDILRRAVQQYEYTLSTAVYGAPVQSSLLGV